MKQLISLVLILLLMSLFSLGCGKTSEPTQAPPSSSTESSATDPASEKPAEPSDSLGAKLSSTYADMMKNNKYFMKYTMTTDYDGKSMEVEASIAVSGDNSAMTSIAEGMQTTIISKGEKTYMVNHSEKMVMELPPDMEPEDGNDNEIDTDELTYLSSGVEDGLTYEKYSTTDGVMNYYFDGKKLVKITFEIEGQTMVMNILEMSNKVTDSMFEIPANYQRTTLPGL